MKIRIDKAISEMGIGTRSEVKKAVRDGRITLNGEVLRDSSIKFDPDQDQITIDHKPFIYEEYVYFLLYKPKGFLSATRDKEDTVLDLIREEIKGLFPVGRLDKDTEGLLIITNDGPLAHTLLSPKHHVEKEYIVTLRDPLKKEDKAAIEEGIRIDQDTVYAPCTILETADPSMVHIILKEGKFHEIKRMFLKVGNEVTDLKRIRMKHLVLDDRLKPGEYRRLSREEIEDLKN